MINLTDDEFVDIVHFVKLNYGINLVNKRQLIESRMYSVLVEKGMDNFSDYIKIIKQKNSDEITVMLNKLTTNHTYFMRESAHFDFLKNIALPELVTIKKNKEMRIWSAGCSSGEEAYSTVMVIKDFLGAQSNLWDYRILATDISANAINKSQCAVYDDLIKDLKPEWINKYFSLQDGTGYVLNQEIKKEVIFQKFNLMDKFPFQQPFDIIFCRNVMIYFDEPTKISLINKFYEVLRPGGYLFIGLSESIRREESKFKYIQPSVYKKE